MNATTVNWALKFVGLNLSALRPDEWQKLREEIREIMRDPGSVERIWGDSRLTHEAITDMQEKARELLGALGLNSLFLNKVYKSPNPHGAFFWKQPFRSVEGLIFFIEGGKMSVRIDANLTETFLFALATAFTTIDPSTFLPCAWCGTPFLSTHGSQKFCSTQCKNRSSSKTFWDKKREEKLRAPRKGLQRQPLGLAASEN